MESERSGNQDAPYMDHNMFSDWTEDELRKLNGVLESIPYNPEDDIKIKEDLDDERRHLKYMENDISYSTDVLGPV